MKNRRFSIYRYGLVLSLALCSAFCMASTSAFAGGVGFNFGIDVPLPGYAPPPPVVAYRAPVVVERAPVVVERTPVVVERTPPPVAYEEPVVVERRSTTVYTYRPAPRPQAYEEETERTYYRHRVQHTESDYDY